MLKFFRNVATFAAAVALSGAAAAQAVQEAPPTIFVVTHGQASDPFWAIVKAGAMQAARDSRAKVEYRAPEAFDMATMGQLIDAAVNQRPAGLVVSNPDPDALGPAIARAVAAGIAVISINAGLAAAPSLGVALHVGQEELSAGRAVGAEIKKRGGTKILCVNQEVGNVSLDQRCQGVTEGFGGPVVVLPTSLEPAEIESKIRAALTSDRAIDVVLSLSAATVGERAVAAVQGLNAGGRVKVASYDLSAHFLKAVSEGRADFAVDQQPFLQGYLPVSFLALRARYGTLPAGNVPSGPRFVNRAQAAQAMGLAAKGIR